MDVDEDEDDDDDYGQHDDDEEDDDEDDDDDDNQYGDYNNDDMHIEFDPMMIDVVYDDDDGYDEVEIVSR